MTIQSKVPNDKYRDGWEILFGAMRRKSGLPEELEPSEPYTQEYLKEEKKD